MRSSLSGLPVVAALLGDAGIKLVDIGGRGSAFGALVPLAPFADYYVSEPDEREAERLKKDLPLEAPWRTVTVLREAIASRRGEAHLYMTHQPGMSSLLEPDLEVTKRFYLAAKFRVATVTKVPTVPLDDAASAYGFTDACFVKLDTQGTELEILQSGSRLLRESLLGVHTESLFHPFYKEQSLFADVDRYLRQNGFSLFSLSRTSLRRSGYRQSVYSKRVIAWAHCLYFREPETLLSADREALRRHLPRLLGLSLAFQHYDLSFEIVDLCRRVRLLAEQVLDQLADEVDRVAALGTQLMIRKAERKGVTDVVMAASFRDKRQFE